MPVTLERWTGDLDGMVKRRQIRALVVYSKSYFFYDKGIPRGIAYEALEVFQRFLNKKLKTGASKVYVTFLPVRVDQLEQALLQGIGDVIALPVAVTPERRQQVAFTVPTASNVKQIIVTGPTAPPIATLDDLGGAKIYANPLTTYYVNLQRLSASLQKAGKPPIDLKAADKNLIDEDLLEMVNAGLIPATVTTSERAEFWAQVLPQLVVHANLILQAEGQFAWVTRKDSPKLKQVLDEAIESHRFSTSFGNTVFRRYLRSTRWVKDATSTREMKKFQAYVEYFKKYAAEYDFDYLMLTAVGYQESLLDQTRRSPRGAVGIMQVIPKYAAARPISIRHVELAENNIHAGAKMLKNIEETYFNDHHLDVLNKTLMTFASYNAGPTRIARLRQKASAQGLDPNRWFGNVEYVVAKDVGQETVQYVSNIYKYYIAYKLTTEQARIRNPGKRLGLSN